MNIKRFDRRCVVCCGPVLGLIGQDLDLDTALLSNAFRDEVLRANFFGPVHSSCLSASCFAKHWMNSFRDVRLAGPGVVTLFADDDGFLQYLPITQELAVWYQRGYYVRLQVSKPPVTSSVKGCVEYRVDSIISAGLVNLSSSLTEIISSIRTDGREMRDIVRRLGIEDRYSDSVVADAKAVPAKNSPQETLNALSKSILFATVEHPLFVPIRHLQAASDAHLLDFAG